MQMSIIFNEYEYPKVLTKNDLELPKNILNENLDEYCLPGRDGSGASRST